ncbi:MAG TPA: hypothetical protein PKG48_12545, partial [Bacteroidales bacterium]|nr:hypothetical protein [Bacteroidales bacterium]
MKKNLLILVSLFLGLTAFSQSSLTNGNFEGWYFAPHPTHPAQGFWEPTGGFFRTLNILDTIATPPGITAYPSDTAHSGTKSARLVTRKINVMDIVIPGVIGTIAINWTSMNATLGQPFTWMTKPVRFQGYYQSYPLLNDSSAAIILLSKWNPETHRRDTIAHNRLVFHGTQSAWTFFDQEITYRDNTTFPDSITVLLLSCAGYNASFMMASVGQVGSKAYFDDVTLTNVSGMEMSLMPEVGVKITPMPVAARMTMEFSRAIRKGEVTLFTSEGKQFAVKPVEGLTTSFDVSFLPSGVYF